MRVHIWIDKKDVQGLAKGTDKIIESWYRKPSFPKKYKDKDNQQQKIIGRESFLFLINKPLKGVKK